MIPLKLFNFRTPGFVFIFVGNIMYLIHATSSTLSMFIIFHPRLQLLASYIQLELTK